MKRLIPILLLLVSGVAHAEEPITGAFGQVLGEVADENLERSYKGDGYIKYTFTPEAITKPFTRYGVEVTPVKRLIFDITAWGTTLNGCETSFVALKTVLDRKYGASSVTSNAHNEATAKWDREKDGRTITLDCGFQSGSGWRLFLQYTDHIIEATSIDELIAEVEAQDNL